MQSNRNNKELTGLPRLGEARWNIYQRTEGKGEFIFIPFSVECKYLGEHGTTHRTWNTDYHHIFIYVCTMYIVHVYIGMSIFR